MLRGLRTVIYPSPDLAAGRAFYAALLERAPYFDEPFYVGFDVFGYELGLTPDGTPGTAGATGYWGVGDVPAALARAEALGAPILEPVQDVGGGIRVAAVADPAGNRVGLIDNPGFVAEVGGRMATTGAGTSPRHLELQVTVAATPEEVWALWTTSEGLARWLLPHSRVSLRVGGPYEFWFRADAPAGLRGGEDNKVLGFLAPRLLVFSWNAPPGMRTRDDHTQVVLELSPAGAGTTVRLTHTGWPADGLADPSTDWPKTFAYFEQAWPAVLQALTEHCGPG